MKRIAWKFVLSSVALLAGTVAHSATTQEPSFTAVHSGKLQWIDPNSPGLPQLQINGVIENAEMDALSKCYNEAADRASVYCLITESKLTDCDKGVCKATATALQEKRGFPSNTYQGQAWVDSYSDLGHFNANELELMGAWNAAQQSALGACHQSNNKYCAPGAMMSIDRCDAGPSGLPGPNTARWRCRITTTAVGWTYYLSPAQMNPQAPTPPSRKPGQSTDGQ